MEKQKLGEYLDTGFLPWGVGRKLSKVAWRSVAIDGDQVDESRPGALLRIRTPHLLGCCLFGGIKSGALANKLLEPHHFPQWHKPLYGAV